MKPVKLEFKGINSFSEQTEIDFENLTKSGIFGIFGDTGSGKSTILDCINFALYGKVERSKEKLDIINYRCESAEVKFDFYALTDGKRKKYCVERSIKKKSGVHKASLYDEAVCIADNPSSVTKKITEILGVDAEDFRKCIALPQGEFSQFVKSQPSERIALIERLFSLSKYGDRLKEKLKLREAQTELSFQTVAAKLGLYSDVSKDVLSEHEKLLEECKSRTAKLTEESASAEQNYLRLKDLSEKRAELNKLNDKLKILQADKAEMDALRAGLKVLPLCNLAVRTSKELTRKKEKSAASLKSLNEIVIQTERASEKLKALSASLKSENLDEAIEKCVSLAALYASVSGKFEKLLTIESELDKKRSDFRQKEKELSVLKAQLQQAETEYAKAEKQLSDLAASDLERLINVDFKGAFLKDEYVHSLDYFVGLRGQVNSFKDDTALYELLSDDLKNKINEYKDRIDAVKEFNLAEAQNKLKHVKNNEEERKRLTQYVNRKTVEWKDAQTAVNNCERDIITIQRDGELFRKQYDEIKVELNEIFGEGKIDYSSVIQKNSENCERLKARKEKLNSEITYANETISRLIAEKASKNAEIDTLSQDITRLDADLKAAVLQSGFENFESCKNFADEFSKYEHAEETLKDYDEALIAVTARKSQLEKTEGIIEFELSKLDEAFSQAKKLSGELNEQREKIAVISSQLIKMRERLEDKTALQCEFEKIESERNLIAQLKDITKGNKFMEYIANEYLYDISKLASSTLLNLTDGRYFLTYTDTFYAGDNFNCGDLRGVNTLSGGETFLVSLSLALALSQTICASLKSIEFFFLDEGFGTLDSALVETVLNALEKLKNSHFTIGIISHVEELKHRIDNKITVIKATENHGSTVKVSC